MKKNLAILCLCLFSAGVFVLLDQWTKALAAANLKGQASIILIKGALQLTYVENAGIAFGLFQGRQYLFALITLPIIAILLFFLYKMPKTKRCIPVLLILTLLIAGSVGNLIDRLHLEYVIDFIYFSLIDFPVFNVADIYVTVSCVMMIILVLFVYKDDELGQWFSLKRHTSGSAGEKPDQNAGSEEDRS